MGVDHVEVEGVGEAITQSAHVTIHRPHPAHERLDVGRERRLGEAVDDDSVAFLGHRQAPAAASEDVHLDPLALEMLGQLANVTREAALDDRRVLPGDQ